MLDLCKLEDAESSVTFERRVRNICSRFSNHGGNFDHHHFLMASPAQHFDVFVPGLISSKRYLSKKGSRKTAAFEFQSVMVARFGDGETFACQSSHSAMNRRCCDKATWRSKARKSMFLSCYWERKQSRIRSPPLAQGVSAQNYSDLQSTG